MSETGQAITVELLTEEEAELAFQIDRAVWRISNCRGDVWSVGLVFGLLAVLVGGVLEFIGRLPFQPFRWLLRAVGDGMFVSAVLGLAAAVVLVSGILAQLLYANWRIRRYEAALSRLAADHRVPRLLEKLTVFQLLAWRTASYRVAFEKLIVPPPAAVRYLRRYFPQLVHC